ncbi:putative phenazine biosynthesis [Diaporthe ampelina]|uniref:Putative phenazine biosynthesis n=1 Tax=Diaporthe ampelina TaxID=1214573 RepID=A0A0G2HZ41_9PEZI|nr:putative phenazine biosynthesis [Diaporthe ampelina]
MQFITVDVFTDTCFLGNPLAVVIVEDKERAALGKDKQQLIAKEFNLSETIFLYLRPGETLQHPDRSSSVREVSIFTIESELPFAGHPTIGTTYLLLQHLGWDFVDTIVPPCGPIRVARSADGRVTASIPHDVHLHSRTLRSLYELGDKDVTAQIKPALHDDDAIQAAELDAPIFSIVKGMTFLLVELPSLEHLAQVDVRKRLDLGEYVSLLDAGPWGHGFTARYYYVPQTVVTDEYGLRNETIRSRMVELDFEDPATGSAASSLTSYLSLKGDADETKYRITQGVELGRKSDIETHIVSKVGPDGTRAIKEVKLGGTARVVMKGEIIL